MIKGNCLYCNQEFISTQSKRKYCSASCKTMFLRKKNNPKQLRDKICEVCGTKYRATHSSRFCSKECGLQSKECLYCAKEFKGHFNSKFCSIPCKDSFKVRKGTGMFVECLVCKETYEITYGGKKNVNQVCSVTCSNIYTSSLSGKAVTIEEIEDFLKNTKEQPTAEITAQELGTSQTTILQRAKEFYGSFREMVIKVRGSYLIIEEDKSYSSNFLFNTIDEIYNVVGIREKTFPELINPLTKMSLRIDYYLENIPVAIEYHGIQHYQEVEFFDNGNKNSFKARQIRDRIKEDFLENKGIPLVIFNYLDKLDEETVRKRLDEYLK